MARPSAPAPIPTPWEASRTGRSRFEHELRARLQRGEHVVLYGPRGSGKSTLVRRTHDYFAGQAIPCGLAASTGCLNDITEAFTRAYPGIDTSGIARRQARARLLAAADRTEGVLLLDHATAIGTAAIGFLRRLRGGIAGVLIVVDVETEDEQRQLRSRHLGTCALPMPPLPAASLRRLFRAQRAARKLPLITPRDERSILRAARGRPGWLSICLGLMQQPAYWHAGLPYLSLLCTDTEIALHLPVAGSPEGVADG